MVTDRDVAGLMERLRGKNWQTAASLGATSDQAKRRLRAICRASQGHIISGQKGYRLTVEVSPSEYASSRGLLQSFADQLQEHVRQLDAVWWSTEQGGPARL